MSDEANCNDNKIDYNFFLKFPLMALSSNCDLLVCVQLPLFTADYRDYLQLKMQNPAEMFNRFPGFYNKIPMCF